MRAPEPLQPSFLRPARFLAGACAVAIGLGGCGQSTETSEPATAPEPAPEETTPEVAAPAFDPAALAAAVGVSPGGWEYPDDLGAAAVVTAHEGTLEVRRVGLETFAAATGDPVALHAGDQLRTGEKSTATLMLADQSVVDVAEDTAIAIGDRDAAADPGASVAVLYGIARFQVSPRGAGEAPFMVFSPSAVATATGTVYTVAVTADGNSRVGVDEGTVEVAGTAKLDAPVAVEKGHATTVDATGNVAAATELAADANWAQWRYETEAKLDAKAAAEANAHALAELRPTVIAAYGELDALAAQSHQVTVEAEAQAKAKDKKAYAQSEPARAATLEATFLASLRLEQLTYAMLGHAYITGQLHLRHPDELAEVYAHHEADLHAAILLHKKYHAVVHAHLLPLRVAFYAHHPVGRVHAEAVGYKVPKFFAKVKIKAVPAAAVKGHLHMAVYMPPKVKKPAKKSVTLAPPKAHWYAGIKGKVKIKARPATWYVRPPKVNASAVLGTAIKGSVKTVFAVPDPAPLAKAKVAIAIHGDLSGHAGAAHEMHGEVNDHAAHGMAVSQEAKGKVGAGIHAGVDVKAGVHANGKAAVGAAGHAAAGAAGKVKSHAVKVKGAVGHATGKVKGGLKAAGKVKVKAPKITPPKVEGKAKVDIKGGLKIGH